MAKVIAMKCWKGYDMNTEIKRMGMRSMWRRAGQYLANSKVKVTVSDPKMETWPQPLMHTQKGTYQAGTPARLLSKLEENKSVQPID